MSTLETIIDSIERDEQAHEMYWSTYFIPEAYQPLESIPQ